MARQRRCWSLTVGAYGYTVSVREREPGGMLYLRWWDPSKANGGNWSWRSLRHTDRKRAEAQARELAAEILTAQRTAHAGRVTLAELFARYEREVSAHKKGSGPAEDRRRMALWQHVLGSSRDVRTIDFPTMDRFVRERRAGRIVVPSDDPERSMRLKRTPSETTVGADIVFLDAVLNWGSRVILADGSRLLSENPIRGYERPRSRNPRRPVADYDRFLKVRAKADAADPQRLFAAFLDLVEALGWRVSAICQIQAGDIDRKTTATAPHGRLRKRGSVDKEGVEMWVPLSGPARSAIDRVLEVNAVIGEMPLFPSPHDASKPWTRWHARDLLERAEEKAEVASLEGGDFHPYRRAWATSRKHLPVKDVAEAGGWRDLRSLQSCYQLVDEATLLAVVMEPTKLREVKSPA